MPFTWSRLLLFSMAFGFRKKLFELKLTAGDLTVRCLCFKSQTVYLHID